MKRYICILPLLSLLCACGTSDRAVPDPGMAAAMAPPAPQAKPLAAEFCAHVAAEAVARAGVFDDATKDRIRQQNYQQCTAIRGQQ